MPTIQQYINDRNKYKVDHTYQRPSDAWSKEDNQKLYSKGGKTEKENTAKTR